MAIFLIIQCLVMVFVVWVIRRNAYVFGGGKSDFTKEFDEATGVSCVVARHPTEAMRQTLSEINFLLAKRQQQKFYSSSFSIPDLVNELFANIRIMVLRLISLHLLAGFVTTLFIFLNLGNSWSLFDFVAQEVALTQLASMSTELYALLLLIVLLTGTIMSVEYVYWLSIRGGMNRKKLALLSFIDIEFQANISDDFQTILTRFIEVQRTMNQQLESNVGKLNDSLTALHLSTQSQAAFATTYREYLETLRSCKIDEVIIDTQKLNKELTTSLQVFEKHLPGIGNMAQVLERTLNQSTQLYKQLNIAIDRDAHFRQGMSEFTDSVRHNGHVTGTLLETLKQVQTHFNQVVQVHAPQIQELDQKFFKYLEDRLQQLQRALELSDQALFKLLAQTYKQKDTTS